MMDIDDKFKKGKYLKSKIWRGLKKYKNNRINFIGRIIAEICTLYSASKRLFNKYNLLYNIKGFIRDIESLRKTRTRLNTMRLF